MDGLGNRLYVAGCPLRWDAFGAVPRGAGRPADLIVEHQEGSVLGEGSYDLVTSLTLRSGRSLLRTPTTS